MVVNWREGIMVRAPGVESRNLKVACDALSVRLRTRLRAGARNRYIVCVALSPDNAPAR